MQKKLMLICLMAILAIPIFSQKKSVKFKEAKGVDHVPERTVMQSEGALNGVKKLSSVEGITEYELDNGLRVLLYPDQSKQTITTNITYKVGSRHEGYGETGMAHLLEHLVFKGTPNHPDIPKELSSHGARPNGTTWYDRTNYFETFNATEENLRWSLDLESDRMINSFIAKKDLESEMTVVRNEFESGENDPSGVLMERVMSTAYLWHNYGQSTIGARSDIENVPIENLQAFYRKYYQPDNAVLMVAGKINEEKTIALVNQYFGKIPRPLRKLTPTYTSEPIQDGERLVTLRRVGDVQAVSCMYHIAPGSHPDASAADVLIELMTAQPAGRLHKALIETKKASSQFGWCATLNEPGFAYFGVSVLKEKSLDEAKNTLLTTIDNISKSPVSTEEVERAKTKLLKDFEMQFRNTERVGTGISEYIGMGDWRLAFITRDYLRKVTVEDVQRVAQKYFKPSNRTIGVFIPETNPERAEIPSKPNIENLVDGYVGDPPIAQGEDFDPSPSNIEKRTHKYQVPNSIKYAFLPKLTKGNVVNANLILRMGDQSNLQGLGTLSMMTSAMLSHGTKTMSRQQIKDEFDKLKARVNFFGSGQVAGVSIQTTKENLPAVMKIVVDILKNPAFPEKEFEELRNEKLAEIEEQKSDPQAQVSNTFQRLLNPYPKEDIRYVNTIDENISNLKSVNINEIKKFHEDFYGANEATFSIVGDFDEKDMKAIVEKEFGTWKSKKPYSRVEDKFIDVKAENINIETPDKANSMFLAGCNLEIKDSDPEYPAMVMANYILGGGFLNSRLATRIRQKEGLSYGVGSQFSADALDKSGGFTAYAIYAPENRDKLEKAFKEEIEKVIKDGFTKQELADAKSGYLQSRTVNRAQDQMLVGALNSNLFINRDMSYTEDFEKKVQNLKVSDLNQAFRKHISLDKISIIKGGDFANKLKKP